jgi:hypothetical protein
MSMTESTLGQASRAGRTTKKTIAQSASRAADLSRFQLRRRPPRGWKPFSRSTFQIVGLSTPISIWRGSFADAARALQHQAIFDALPDVAGETTPCAAHPDDFLVTMSLIESSPTSAPLENSGTHGPLVTALFQQRAGARPEWTPAMAVRLRSRHRVHEARSSTTHEPRPRFP